MLKFRVPVRGGKTSVILVLVSLLTVLSGCARWMSVVPVEPEKQPSGALYYLPRHQVELRFSLIARQIMPGPYAEFAESLLGIINVPREPEMRYDMRGVRLTTMVEADPKLAFEVRGQSASVPFLRLAEGGHILPVNMPVVHRPEMRCAVTMPPSMPFVDLSPQPFIDQQANTFYQVLQSDTAFVRVPVQRNVTVKMSKEEKARQAAELIFNLRKKRFELISGEVDLANSPGTLSVMLQEMARLEKLYLELFVGRVQTDTVEAKVYLFPQPGQEAIIPCRFSTTHGIVGPSELDATPVIFNVEPETRPDATVPSKTLHTSFYYRPAMPVNYTITLDGEMLLNGRLSLYQYGPIITVPIRGAAVQ